LNRTKDMNMKTHRFRVLCILSSVLGLFATSCNLPQPVADSTRFYVLAAKPGPTTAASEHRWKIALQPVEVPLFLRSKPMAVRVASNEVRYVDDARWAEPLDSGVMRVIREQLEAMSEIAQVVTANDLGGITPDYLVVVRVLRCEGDLTGKEGLARFIASVEVHSPKGERLARDTLHSEVGDWDGKDYDALARKLSEAVRDLASRVPALLEKAAESKT
jgi:uncharacterized lipoprotein YmbA